MAKSNVTARTVDLTWTAGGEETEWQICLNGDEDNLIVATTNPYTLSTLTPETAYTVKVRANCGSEQSSWSNTVSFTTLPTCPVPTALAYADVTTTSAVLSWTTGASETAWQICINNNEDELIKKGYVNPFKWNLPQDTYRYNLFKLRNSEYYVVVMPKVTWEERLNAHLHQYGF